MSADFIQRVRQAAAYAFIVAYNADADRAIQAALDEDLAPSMSFIPRSRA